MARVPTEVIKQRAQAHPGRPLLQILSHTLAKRSMYQGYWSTVLREIPFSFIQFPLWEQLKLKLAKLQNKRQVSPLGAAGCGCVAGGIAAGLTTVEIRQ